MKNKISLAFILFLVLNSKIIAQDNYVVKDAVDFYDEILNYNKNDSTIKLYAACLDDFDYLLKKSEKKYKIIYIASHWYKLIVFPKIVKFANKNEANVDLYVVFGNQYKTIPGILWYMDFHEYYKPFFILDVNKMGNKGGIFHEYSRINKLISFLCPECNYKKIDYSDYIVLDKDNKVVFYTTVKDGRKDKINLLKNLDMNK